ncbi:MAG: hypothetical protein WCC32_19715 [Terriglobales bacterium]
MPGISRHRGGESPEYAARAKIGKQRAARIKAREHHVVEPPHVRFRPWQSRLVVAVNPKSH